MGVEKAIFHTLVNPDLRGKMQQVPTNMVSSSDLSYSKLGVLKVEHTNHLPDSHSRKTISLLFFVVLQS